MKIRAYVRKICEKCRRAITSISSITKMRSSSLICLLAAIVASR